MTQASDNRQDHVLSNSASWEHTDGQSAYALRPGQAGPGGAGARRCIGRHQAEYLLTDFLSAVLREFELVPMSDVAVTFSATVSVTPSSVPVRLVPRQVPARREAGLEDRIDQRADGALRLNRDPAVGCPARLNGAT